MLGSEKSSCVKLNISSAASSVETKSIPQMLELIAGETSEYPSGAVRVAGSFVDVKQWCDQFHRDWKNRKMKRFP